MKKFCAFLAVVLSLVGIGCNLARGGDEPTFVGPSALVAEMPGPYSVHLEWKNHATAGGGNLVVGRLAVARQTQRPQPLRSGKDAKPFLLIVAHGRGCLLRAQLLYARGRGPLFVVFALGRRLGAHVAILTHLSLLQS